MRWVVCVCLFLACEPVLASLVQPHEKVCGVLPWGTGGRPQVPAWVLDLPAVRAIRGSLHVSGLLAKLVETPLFQHTLHRITHPRSNPASLVPEVGAMVLMQYTAAEANIPDRPMWEVLESDLWGTPSDAPSVGLACFVGITSMYLASWLTMGGFWFSLIMTGQRAAARTTEQGHITLMLGWAAFFTSLMFALAADRCTVLSENTSSPCFTKSRKRFNYIWPGMMLLNLGNHLTIKPQEKDESLEKFVLDRQMMRDKVLRQNSDYESNPAYAVHKGSVEASKQLQNIEQMTKDAAPSAEQGSLVLAPVHGGLFDSLISILKQKQMPGHGAAGTQMLSLIGMVWIFVVVCLVVLSCASTGNSATIGALMEAKSPLTSATPFALSPAAVDLIDGVVEKSQI